MCSEKKTIFSYVLLGEENLNTNHINTQILNENLGRLLPKMIGDSFFNLMSMLTVITAYIFFHSNS